MDGIGLHQAHPDLKQFQGSTFVASLRQIRETIGIYDLWAYLGVALKSKCPLKQGAPWKGNPSQKGHLGFRVFRVEGFRV